MKPDGVRPWLGWLAVTVSTLMTCFWAFWGISENFHEGWYHPTLWANLALMVVQYLSPMLLFMGVTLLAIRWPRLGGGLHVLLAGLTAWFFQASSNAATCLIVLPLIGLGGLYWFGHLSPRKLALSLAAGLPLLTLIVAGIPPAVRVSQRVNDGHLAARLVPGHGVALVWAPAGPGWPATGTDWPAAQRACRYLGADGVTLAATPQHVWRLPTVDEAVRSMARHGRNSGGVWDAGSAAASYETRPDKESPLWDVYSQVIYWWTATEVDDDRAYIVAYDGRVWPRARQWGPAYLGFRCVRPPAQ